MNGTQVEEENKKHSDKVVGEMFSIKWNRKAYKSDEFTTKTYG